MGHAHSFKVSFVSSANEMAVPELSQFLAKIRSGPAWDEATISPEDGEFPRMYLAWLEGRGYFVHCFENDAALGDFLTVEADLSEPEVEVNLGGQALEIWPPQLFVAEEVAARAVEFFLDFGKRNPAQRWVGTDVFPRNVIWESREQREAWERSQGQGRDA